MKKYKYIIHISDIHVRKMSRHQEYIMVFERLISKISSIVKTNNEDFLIVITGDLFHQKIDISNEQQTLLKNLLSDLSNIAEVIVIAGNHDLLVNNKDRMDSITPIIDALNDDRIHYLKESKLYEFDNIVFANYSVFEDNKRPNIEAYKESLTESNERVFIGLYHAPLNGSKTEMGFGFDTSDNVQIFEGLDFVMCGDIHLHQQVKCDIPVVYAGSLIQQSFGENLSGHGFLVWNVNSKNYKHFEIENENTMVKIEIGSINNLENDLKIVNE